MPTDSRPTTNMLTTTSGVKLARYEWFSAPDEDEMDDNRAIKPWTTYGNVVDYIDRHAKGRIDHNVMIADGGRVEVGLLKDTKRTVYATFHTGSNEHSMMEKDIIEFENGAQRIKLVAQPVDHRNYFNYYLVNEAELTDQHGLSGFVPCAEVLDWEVIKFDKQFRDTDIVGSYNKVYEFLWEECGWTRLG